MIFAHVSTESEICEAGPVPIEASGDYLHSARCRHFGGSETFAFKSVEKPMGHYVGGRNGGSLSEDTRQIFHDAVDTVIHWDIVRMGPEPTVSIDEERQITVSRACGLAWNCTDMLPRDLRFRLESLFGTPLNCLTYSDGARRLKEFIVFLRSHVSAVTQRAR
jgi:hypothetical protein